MVSRMHNEKKIIQNQLYNESKVFLAALTYIAFLGQKGLQLKISSRPSLKTSLKTSRLLPYSFTEKEHLIHSNRK